ncbi:sigma-54 interaction domain-containing protein [Mesobacillus harenae]|uniref:sigma-54 interaction domain-containing protein n=1 Tax=Mesobacillus harenae TaxID=2213203 RepID=UPI0030D10A65
MEKHLLFESIKLDVKNLEDSLIKEGINYIYMKKEDEVYCAKVANFLKQYRSGRDILFSKMSDKRNENDDRIDFETILSSLYDIVHVTDVEGNTIYCSKNYEDYIGLNPEKMMGKKVADFFNLGYFTPSITQRVIDTKKKTSTIQNTYKNRKLFVQGIPYFDKQGGFKGVVNLSTDITHKEKLLKEQKEVQKLGSIYFEEALRHLDNNETHTPVIYRSESMNQSIQLANRLSQVDSSIIITGESGVGKGVLVRYIHDNSLRKNGEFVHINCGAIPESLIESELFGYEKGAFTGAQKEGRKGLVEKANGGTLFLDEIAELPLNLQVKLLTVLQEKKLTRIGGTKPVDLDIRLITATNKNLRQMVQEGTFREDLFYRIFVIPIEIPPLRERKEDIPVLIHYFIDLYSNRFFLDRRLSEKCFQILEQYDWPGNVRELQNLIERLVVMSNGEIITSDQIPYYIKEKLQSHLTGLTVHEMMPIPEAIEEVEKQLLLMAYKLHGSTTKVAKALGISQASASRKLTKYSIQ